jgi:type II secretory pathway component PulF
MTTFFYRAITPLGLVISGKIDAQSPHHLDKYLRAKRFDLIACRKVRKLWLPHSYKVSHDELIQLTLHLAHMESAGLPLLQSLYDFSQQSLKSQNLIKTIIHSLESGQMLSQALEKHQQIFNPLFIQFIRIGEHTGQLAECFSQLHQHLLWTRSLHDQIQKAILYPCIMLIVFLPSMATLIVCMIPPFVNFMHSMQLEVPLITHALYVTASFLRDYWPIFTSSLVIMTFVIRQSLKKWKKIQRWLERTPLLRKLLQSLAMVRLFHALNRLCANHVNLLEALKASLLLTTSPQLYLHLAYVIRQVEHGSLLSHAMECSGIFPNSITSMIATGEQAGTLPNALENIEHHLHRQVKQQLESCIALTEPALILIMGLFLLLIVYAVFWPLYDTLTFVDL